jgi:hypothetical protein
MSTSAKPDSGQNELGSPPSREKSAANEHSIEDIRDFGANELLRWIQQKKPKLLASQNVEDFQNASITGNAFLDHAGDRKFFREDCKLPGGPSYDLADLASKTI